VRVLVWVLSLVLLVLACRLALLFVLELRWVLHLPSVLVMPC
jgi:hypothetical protein